jgi:hypothetical protein
VIITKVITLAGAFTGVLRVHHRYDASPSTPGHNCRLIFKEAILTLVAATIQLKPFRSKAGSPAEVDSAALVAKVIQPLPWIANNRA